MTEQEYVMLLCKRIKEERLKLNLTQLDVASAMGTDDSTYRTIELGRGNPTIKTLFKISEVLGIELKELIPLKK